MGGRHAAGADRRCPPYRALRPATRTVDLPSSRELEVIERVARGRSNKEVANELRISEATVKTHLVHIVEKLGVVDRTAAVTSAIERGLIELSHS